MSVEQRGAEEAAESLEAVAARLRDLTPITSVVAADVMTFVDDRFANATDPGGQPWATLEDSTIARRRSGPGSSRFAVGTVSPLIDTGRLRSSIFGRGERTGLRFGTNVAYAAPHQLGTRKMPRRAFLPVDSAGSAFSLSSAGPGGEFWRDARERIRRFIRTGEVT